MGCDIHPLIEVKQRPWVGGSERWVCAGEPNLCRNYHVFGILAGVRGEGPPIQMGRGIDTTGMSEAGEALLKEWEDFHSHGYVTLAEMKAYQEVPLPPEFGPSSWPNLVAQLEAVRAREGATDDNVRLVFAFDN